MKCSSYAPAFESNLEIKIFVFAHYRYIYDDCATFIEDYRAQSVTQFKKLFVTST